MVRDAHSSHHATVRSRRPSISAAGQGRGAVDAALALARGEDVETKVYVPFQLVTPENMGDFMASN